MRRPACLVFAALGFAVPAAAEPVPATYHLRYEAFSLGLAIMEMDVSFRISPRSYDIALSYHTIGLARFLYPGHQSERVIGSWEGDRAAPQQFLGSGEWRGRARSIDIVYRDGQPRVIELSPPNHERREPVPFSLQHGTEDTLSALAQLLRHVERNGTCDTEARLFDGRRLSEVYASTVGLQSLRRTDGAIFAGTALRCNFVGRMLAGFLLDRPHTTPGRPRRGSAWFASLEPGAPALAVRMQFGTDWFGNVTMVLTSATPQPPEMAQTASSHR